MWMQGNGEGREGARREGGERESWGEGRTPAAAPATTEGAIVVFLGWVWVGWWDGMTGMG